MKRIIILSAALVIVVVAVGAVFLVLSKGAPEPANTKKTPPSVPGSSGYSVTLQQSQDSRAVQAAYQSVLSKNNFDNVRLYQTAISEGYALQSWKGDSIGGEALLKFDTAQNKWIIVDPGGGAWSVLGLVQMGVPQSAAESLVAGMPR